jgi:hypothetical protein
MNISVMLSLVGMNGWERKDIVEEMLDKIAREAFIASIQSQEWDGGRSTDSTSDSSNGENVQKDYEFSSFLFDLVCRKWIFFWIVT